MYTHVRLLYVCVSRNGISVSPALYNVTAYPDPDPSLRTTSHHPSQSLMALPPQGLHCRMSFERLRGSFAAGSPESKTMHETGEKGEEDCCQIAT